MFSDMPRPIANGESDGNLDFPNMSDGDDLTIYNNRLTNVTIAKVKSYKGNLYVEVEGDLNITGQATGYDSWTITNAIASSITFDKRFETYIEVDPAYRSNFGIFGAYVNNNRSVGVITYGSGSFVGRHIHIKIVLHQQ